MTRNLYCVIMAGGGGNNFWPVTREDLPQHFMSPSYVGGAHVSFLRGTYNRFAEFIPPERILVVTLARFADRVRHDLPELPEENILLEPFGRKTAPCIAFAACVIRQRDPEAIMIATPADHIITEGPLFSGSVLDAAKYVDENDVLMTLGIIPTAPKPDYGYIQIQGGPEARNSGDPMPVKTFTEKPDVELAEVFFNSGEFFWNSGIFVWRNATIIEQLYRYVPYLVPMLDGWPSGREAQESFLERVYADCEKESIDYAVMEKTDRAWLYPARFGWADIGSWDALYRSLHTRKDALGNVSNTDYVYLQENEGNLILSQDKRKLIAIKGLQNYMVVDAGDVLLVCPRNDREFKDFISGIAMPGYEPFR